MRPVLTPAEMAALDAAAPEGLDVLIERAGAAVARAARAMLGGTYGRRVVVVAGPGHNGDDGRVAATHLARAGVRVRVVAPGPDADLRGADLVVDAAFGTGARPGYQAPDPRGTPVLAVDLPSGVDGLTGRAAPGAVQATRTVTFAALKPGLLLGAGPARAGVVEVADIGLRPGPARVHLVEADDLRRWLPRRRADAHKWSAAVDVVAGSAGMHGAAHLAARAAQRAGAGMVRLASPGFAPGPWVPLEAVGRALPAVGWEAVVGADLERSRALVVGPGLGRAEETAAAVRRLVARAELPVVVDGDGLWALGWNADGPAAVLRARRHPTVLTPHDGEYVYLAGERPPPDRIDAARSLAVRLRAVVLLKGPATVVAEPGGRVLVVTSGDQRLASAGTGDVLAGMVGALVAQGLPAFEAAAAAADWHGRAARRAPVGMVAGDLPELLAPARAALGR